MRQFWFDSQSSAHHGLIISGSGTFNAPERDVEKVSVPGRNGDLILDNGRFKNVTVSYPVILCRDFPEKSAAARRWLMSKSGYKRLEDSYNPNVFRMAMFKGPIDFDVAFLNRAGEATLKFDCKPQRYLKSGELPISLDAPGTLWNPTNFDALPLITVHGNDVGSITVGGMPMALVLDNGDIILDCEMQNAYSYQEDGTLVNRNNSIYTPDFPLLPPGEVAVTWDGGVTGLEIIPRWWTL